MKIAVIYYSYDGNCKFVAEHIARLAGGDLFRIETLDEKRRTGLAKYVWGGRQVFLRRRPELKPCAANLAGYELVILGAPVWAGSPAPALRSFIAKTTFTGKKLALFLCHAGGKGKAAEKLKALLADAAVTGEIDFANPLKHQEGLDKKLSDWLGAVTGNV